MQHKLLLGSTALVSAALLMSGAAQAQEMEVGGIEVTLGGYTEFCVRGANEDTNVDLDDASDLLALSGALNLYLLRDRIKAQLQYTHRREPNADGEAENDTAVLQLHARL